MRINNIVRTRACLLEGKIVQTIKSDQFNAADCYLFLNFRNI